MLKKIFRFSPRVLFGLFLLSVVVAHVVGAFPLQVLRVLDTHFYDEKIRLSLPGLQDSPVAVIDIDEKSLAAEGRWPWSRNKIARMINQLFDQYEVASVGFDIVFAEPDNSSGLGALQQLAKGPLREDVAYQAALRRVAPSLRYDEVLAASLKGRPVVLGYYFSQKEDSPQGATGQLPPPLLTLEDVPELKLRQWTSYGANLPVLADAAPAGGYMNFIGDFDGNARRVPLLSTFEGGIYESLSMALLRTTLGGALAFNFGEGGQGDLESIQLRSPLGRLRVPVDPNGSALVTFYGPAKTVPYLSATDVIHGTLPKEALAGKIVIVGTSAPGLLDLRSTPVGTVYPGVEIHANLIAAMLNGEIRERPGFMLGVEVVMLVGLTLIMLLVLPRLGPLTATGFVALLMAGLVALNWLAWESMWVLLIAPQLALLGGLYLFDMAWGYLSEYRRKKHFTDLFGQYVPPELVAEMAKAPEAYSMEGRNETLTVLFSDVRDFTTISESLNPKDLSRLMNLYLDTMTQLIRGQRGTLDKYIGDAIMAFWGAPLKDEKHAYHAVLSALQMIDAQKVLEADFASRQWPVLRIGIGISTGNMTVGDMGSPIRKAYTVMGDAVNLGARLEGLTKEYGLQLLISEATKAAVPEFACREIDLVRVKGKLIPVAIYEPMGLLDQLSDEQKQAIEDWNAFRQAYRQQDWQRAEAILARLQAAEPQSHLYRLYRERLDALSANPPGPDWDGVVVFKTK